MKPLILIAMLASACTSSDETVLTANKQEMTNNIHQPLEKAKAVEQEILDNAEMQKKQLEAL